MASLATESLPPPVTTPSIPDEPLRRLRPTTSLGALAGVPIRFARTADGAHLAYVVVGPSDHAKPSEKKRKGKMRSTRAVTTPLVMLPGLGMVKEDWGDFAYGGYLLTPLTLR